MLFPTTIAGSLPKPEWLAEPNTLWAPWRSKGDELARAKRALWAAEQRFRNILRRNAQARCNSPRLDDAVSEAHQGMAAIRAFYEGN